MCRVTVNRQADAAVVELVGNIERRPRCGSAIDDAREQPGGADGIIGVAHRPGPHRQADGDGGRCVGVLAEEDRAVVEDRAGGVETGGKAQV